MLKSKLYLITLLLVFNLNYGQNNVYLTITHTLGTSSFSLNNVITNNLGQSVKITRVDYYISSIKIIYNGGQELTVPNKYILVKGNSNVVESLGSFSITNIEGVKFSIGVESPTNNADITLLPTTHPLSFQNPSMHWGWSSGYIFLALEGGAGNNYTTTVQQHGTGNLNYFSQSKTVTPIVNSSGTYINLKADYIEAYKNINVNNGPIDHGVGKTDLTALQNFRDFVFSATNVIPQTSPISAIVDNHFYLNNIELYPNPSNGLINIRFNALSTEITSLEIFDMTGQKVKHIDWNIFQNTLKIDTKGVFFIQFKNQHQVLGFKKIIIQ